MALETGLSLWGAIGEAIKRQLLPQRALAALKSFANLIEDARAMLGGTYAERLEETASAEAEAGESAVPQATRLRKRGCRERCTGRSG